MKKINLFTVMVLLVSCLVMSSCGIERRNNSLKRFYGITSNPFNEDSLVDGAYEAKYGEFKLESANCYITNKESMHGSYFLICGKINKETDIAEDFKMIIKFPNGSRVFNIPAKQLVINYDSIHPRIKMSYDYLLSILPHSEQCGTFCEDPIYIYIPKKSILTDKADKNSFKYESIK